MKKTTTDRRISGNRRWGMEIEFPLKDSNGVLVLANRRHLPDRRLDNTSLEDRLVMFAGMPPVENE